MKHDTWEGEDGEVGIWCDRDGTVSDRNRDRLDLAWRRMRGRGRLSQTRTWF